MLQIRQEVDASTHDIGVPTPSCGAAGKSQPTNASLKSLDWLKPTQSPKINNLLFSKHPKTIAVKLHVSTSTFQPPLKTNPISEFHTRHEPPDLFVIVPRGWFVWGSPHLDARVWILLRV
jgi:hypothetical protein